MVEKYKDSEWLEREYVEKNRSTNDIAEEFDITYSTISYWLHENGIRTGERDRYKYICPDCNLPFKLPSQHFQRSNCERPEFSDVQREMLKGLVMGDGSIHHYSKNWSVRWESTNKEFMEWFNWKIGDLGIQVREIEQTLEETEERFKNSFSRDVEGYDFHKMYSWSSITHPQIKREFNNWVNGEKKFPEDLELNPVNTCIWYCGDGGLIWSGDHSACASISTVNESNNIENIRESFEEVGFHPSIEQQVRTGSGSEHIYSRIRFSVEETEKLLEYMGGAPPGMEYKWETESYRKYKDLMGDSKEPLQSPIKHDNREY